MSKVEQAERIEAVDMAYHAKVVERVKWAQQAQVEIAGIEGAFRSWGEHLHQKYGLDAQRGESVDENGVIVRRGENNGDQA